MIKAACHCTAVRFEIAEPPTLSYVGEPIEQGKMMIVDPSGNLIEIKAYRHPAEVLGPLAQE